MKNLAAFNFDKEVENYWKELLYCKAIFTIYKSMLFNEKWNKLYDISQAYFTTVKYSLFITLIISIYRIYKSTNQQNTDDIFKFIEKAEKNYKNNIENIVEDFKNKLTLKSDLLNNIFKWRNKHIAHLDTAFFMDSKKLEIEYPIKIDDLEELINITLEYISKIFYAITNKSLSPEHFNVNDFENLLNYDYYFAKEQKLKKLLEHT